MLICNAMTCHMKCGGCWWIVLTRRELCAVSQFNVSPAMTLELIERLTKVFKDYCGVLTEESMKKNFILIYELLDEVIVRSVRGTL